MKNEKLLVCHDVLFDEIEEGHWNQGIQQENPKVI